MLLILDQFRRLLLRQEVAIGNLSDMDMGIFMVAAGLAIPSGISISEREVTERLHQWLSTVGTNVQEDAVALRRCLVDCRCLERDPAGRAYARTPEWPSKWQEISGALGTVNIELFAEQVRTDEAERRALRKQAALQRKDLGSSGQQK